MESRPVYHGWGVVWTLEDDIVHRIDGPAVVYKSGRKDWYVYDKRHRLDGPAIELPSGKNEWCINGIFVTTKINQWAKDFNIDLDNLTDEDKQMIALYWADY